VLQVLGVIIELAQALPQLPLGYWQAPLPLQLVAPQPPPVVQAAEQQLPLPEVPQTLLVHSWAPPQPLPSLFFDWQALEPSQ